LGFLYSAQRKWRNGENNRTLTLTLSLILGPIPNPNPNPNPDPNLIPHPKPNPKRLFSPLRHLRCAIGVAPNTNGAKAKIIV